MKVLAIDLSSARGSVAVADNGQLTEERTFECERGRGAEVFAVLERLRTAWRGVELIAVGIGPGSYNGLRAACALANSMQMATGGRLSTAPSVCLLPVKEAHYFVCGDARGGRAYCAEVNDRRLCGEIALVTHNEAAQLAGKVAAPVYRVGTIPGAEQIAESNPSAAVLALLAPQLNAAAPSRLEPIYLKPPHITLSRASRT